MAALSSAFSLRQLQYIVAVADHGGFGRAAHACHVSQPSLSAQIAGVEQQLGVRLFERNRRGVRVAAAAAPLIEQARRVLLAAGDLMELAQQGADPLRGALRIGVIPTIAPYLLPELTPPLREAFPHLQLSWTEAPTGDLVRQINAGSLDAALLAREADIADLECADLGRDSFVLAAAHGHPLMRKLKRTRATPDVLADTSVLLLDDAHCLRDQALALCRRAGASENSFRATSLSTLVQMVSTGDTVTLLPSLALAVENRRGQLEVRSFKAPEPGRTLALAWRKGSSLRPALATIAATMKKTYRK
jgi:LysR family hydrogen peroxide-inducible transcriptional activator